MSQLREIRERIKATQSAMAEELGLSLRAYQDIEAGVSKERYAHVMAAEYMALGHAAQYGDISLVSPETRRLALKLARLIDGSTDPDQAEEALRPSIDGLVWVDRRTGRISKPRA